MSVRLGACLGLAASLLAAGAPPVSAETCDQITPNRDLIELFTSATERTPFDSVPKEKLSIPLCRLGEAGGRFKIKWQDQEAWVWQRHFQTTEYIPKPGFPPRTPNEPSGTSASLEQDKEPALMLPTHVLFNPLPGTDQLTPGRLLQTIEINKET